MIMMMPTFLLAAIYCCLYNIIFSANANAVVIDMEAHPNSLINYDRITSKRSSSSNLNLDLDLDGVSLKASPDAMIEDGDLVKVSFISAAYLNLKEIYIASYSPSTVDITKTAPVTYKSVSGISGDVYFSLVNMRSDYVFVLFNGSLASPVELARSNIVTFRNSNFPRARRLMLTHNPNEMRISWSSARSDLNPKVIYWPTDTPTLSWRKNISCESKTYSISDVCGNPARSTGWRDPGFVHSVVLPNLTPGLEYSYSIGADDEISTKVYSFTLPTVNSDDSYPYSFLAYADQGQTTSDKAQTERNFHFALVVSQLAASLITTDASVKLVVHPGDVSYAMGYLADWDIFTYMNENISARVPYAVSVGNHEADYPNSSTALTGNDSGGECGVPVQIQYPTTQPEINKPWFYFTSGPVFYFMMSTEHDFSKGSEQYNYIENVFLNIVDRSITPWVIFTGHRPMYIDSTNNVDLVGDQPVATNLREYIEPLLLNAGGEKVDITIWGHHHSYQRMCASFGGECKQRASDSGVYDNPEYPIPIVIGTAGPGFSKNIQVPTPEFVEKVLFMHGLSKITVYNKSTMEFQFYAAKDGDEIEVFDRFFINK